MEIPGVGVRAEGQHFAPGVPVVQASRGITIAPAALQTP